MKKIIVNGEEWGAFTDEELAAMYPSAMHSTEPELPEAIANESVWPILGLLALLYGFAACIPLLFRWMA